MLTRRSLLRRAVGALAAGTLAGVSRWLPAPVADRLVLPEPVPLAVDRDWQWYSDTNVLLKPLTPESFDLALERVKRSSFMPPRIEIVSPAERKLRSGATRA